MVVSQGQTATSEEGRGVVGGVCGIRFIQVFAIEALQSNSPLDTFTGLRDNEGRMPELEVSLAGVIIKSLVLRLIS